MGLFSKTCAKTHLPVVNMMRGFPELAKVVALLPDGQIVAGFYDGYGRIETDDDAIAAICEDESENFDCVKWDSVKFVLRFAYNGETYDQLGPSHDEYAQGHFMADEFLKHCLEVRRFPSFKGYERAFKKLANW